MTYASIEHLSDDEVWKHAKVAIDYKYDCGDCYYCRCMIEWRRRRKNKKQEALIMAKKFERRHYEAIAETLRNCHIHHPESNILQDMGIKTLQDVIEDLAKMFKSDSSKFDKERFIRRCGWH